MTRKVSASGSHSAQKESPDKRKRAGKSKKAEEGNRAIPRDVFLTGRVLCMQNEEPPPVYRLKSLPCTPFSSPILRPQPPPGLALPPGLDFSLDIEGEGTDSEETKPEPTRMMEQSEPEQFKALLQNLPVSMLNESMLRVMLEQAQLTDITEVAYRNGKALLTFTSYESVQKCLMHCNGRVWSNSTSPVVAMYVRTVQKTQKEPVVPQTQPETGSMQTETGPMQRQLSADAPTFVPGSLQIPTTTLSAKAPIWVPSDCADIKDKDSKDRSISNASTESGVSDKMPSDKESEECDSEPGFPSHLPFESEVPFVCT